MTVFDLKKGQSATVTAVKLGGGEGARLWALGLKNGIQVQVLSFSLFKSAVLVEFGGVRLAMRREFAQNIEVRP